MCRSRGCSPTTWPRALHGFAGLGFAASGGFWTLVGSWAMLGIAIGVAQPAVDRDGVGALVRVDSQCDHDTARP